MHCDLGVMHSISINYQKWSFESILMSNSFPQSLLLMIDSPIWISEDFCLVIDKGHLSVFPFILSFDVQKTNQKSFATQSCKYDIYCDDVYIFI